MVLGASFDSQAENKAFREKFSFPFPLLCDETRSLGLAYGACTDRAAAHATRTTTVIGPDGKVLRHYPKVDAKTHVAQVLADL